MAARVSPAFAATFALLLGCPPAPESAPAPLGAPGADPGPPGPAGHAPGDGAPRPVAGGPGAAAPILPAPGTPGAERFGSVRLDVQFVAIEGSRVRSVGPEGETTFPLTDGATTNYTPSPGDAVMLEARPTPTASYEVVAIKPHTGLPIAYGKVTALTPTSVTIVNPLGTSSYTLNRWTDQPKDLTVGQWVSVKHYATDDGDAVLNIRRYAGAVEDVGVVESLEGGKVVLRTLGGARTYTATPPAGTAVGDLLTARSTRGKDGAPLDPTLTATPGPLTFIGKMSTWDAASSMFSMVDAWGNLLGVVHFYLPDGVPEGVVPGDLVEVQYTWKGATPMITTLHERVLSQVYFGHLDVLDDARVVVTTLQRQRKELIRTPETWLPRPVQAGDMADVIYSLDPAGGPPIAQVIVKE